MGEEEVSVPMPATADAASGPKVGNEDGRGSSRGTVDVVAERSGQPAGPQRSSKAKRLISSSQERKAQKTRHVALALRQHSNSSNLGEDIKLPGEDHFELSPEQSVCLQARIAKHATLALRQHSNSSNIGEDIKLPGEEAMKIAPKTGAEVEKQPEDIQPPGEEEEKAMEPRSELTETGAHVEHHSEKQN